jgi:HlyD family secretion protein
MTAATKPGETAKIVKLVPAAKPAEEVTVTNTTPAKPTRRGWSMRTMLLAGTAFLAIAGVAGYYATPYVLGVKVTPYSVTRENIVQTIVANGQLETASRVELGSQITGTVSEVRVKEGDAVKAGDVLAVLDSGDATAILDQSTAALKQAEAKLALIASYNLPSAQQSLKQNQAILRNIKLQLDRVNKLSAQGYATRASREDTQRAYDIAASQVNASELAVKSLSPGGSDVAFANAAVTLAQAAVRSSQSRLGLLQVTAPFDGKVMSRGVEPGNVIQASQVLFMLAPPNGKRLVVQIDERSFSLIKLGQTAIASADAYPAERFVAHVSDINPAVDPQRGSVEVKLDIDNAPAYLREDMTVSVDIEVAKRDAALVLPTAAVRDAMGSNPHVLVITAGRAEDRNVTLGTRGQTKTEILSGLVEKDLVIPVSASTVLKGDKVRAAAVVATP